MNVASLLQAFKHWLPCGIAVACFAIGSSTGSELLFPKSAAFSHIPSSHVSACTGCLATHYDNSEPGGLTGFTDGVKVGNGPSWTLGVDIVSVSGSLNIASGECEDYQGGQPCGGIKFCKGITSISFTIYPQGGADQWPEDFEVYGVDNIDFTDLSFPNWSFMGGIPGNGRMYTEASSWIAACDGANTFKELNAYSGQPPGGDLIAWFIFGMKCALCVD